MIWLLLFVRGFGCKDPELASSWLLRVAKNIMRIGKGLRSDALEHAPAEIVLFLLDSLFRIELALFRELSYFASYLFRRTLIPIR